MFGKFDTSEEKSNTLNLLHCYLDGFKTKEDVFLIAIVNHVSLLPESFIRSGRLDKHIRIELLDEKSREEIIEFYLNSIKINKEIDICELILHTHKLSGSNIKTAINEAAIESVMKDIKLDNKLVLKHIRRINNKDLLELRKEDKNSIVAYHELGHFIVANKLKNKIIDVSIISKKDNLGRVRVQNVERVVSKQDLLDTATILVAGRVSEIIFFKKTYMASGLEMAAAFRIVQQFLLMGMDKFKYIEPTLKPTDKVAKILRRKILRILKKVFRKETKIIKQNKKILELIHDELLEKGVLPSKELEKYVEGDTTDEAYLDSLFSYD